MWTPPGKSAPGGKPKRTEIEMPTIDSWCEYSQTKAIPNIDDSWLYDCCEDLEAKASGTPRYCRACGHKLSRYNPGNYCWNGSCQPKEKKKPYQYYKPKPMKSCKICGADIVKGRFCKACGSAVYKRKSTWAKYHPGTKPPESYLYAERGTVSKWDVLRVEAD